jgi:hypothetical protein
MGKLIVVLMFAVVLAIPAQTDAANLLSNSGFELGSFSDWGQWNGANTAINNWGRTGSYSAAGWWATSAWQDAIIDNADTQIKVGGYLYDDVSGNESLRNGGYASIRVEFKDSADNVVGTWTTGNLTGADLADNAWTDKTAVITPSSYGAGINHATLVWEVNNSGSGDGRGIFDDLMIDTQPIPEPTSLLLLGSGLIGLFGIGKKNLKK